MLNPFYFVERCIDESGKPVIYDGCKVISQTSAADRVGIQTSQLVGYSTIKLPTVQFHSQN